MEWVDGDEGGAEEGEGEELGEDEIGEEEVLDDDDGFGEGDEVEAELVGFFVGEVFVEDVAGKPDEEGVEEEGGEGDKGVRDEGADEDEEGGVFDEGVEGGLEGGGGELDDVFVDGEAVKF